MRYTACYAAPSMTTRLIQAVETTLEARLAPMVEDRQKLIAERDRLIAEITKVSDDISQSLVLADQKSARVAGYVVTLVENPGRQSLDKHRLVELGVSPTQILQATTRSAPYVTLQVRRVAEE